MRVFLALLTCLIWLSGISFSRANELHEEQIRSAVAKSLPLLEKSARGSMEYSKQCFNCHNQGLPILTMVKAHERGFELDSEHLQQQLEFIANFLAKNKERYREGKGQGGQVDMAGYALWTLAAGGWKADETTSAVTEYLLLYGKDKDHWESISRRPPSEQSAFTATFLAIRGLQHYGTPEQQEQITARMAEVRQWLESAKPEDTEDRVFRLRGLKLVGAEPETLDKAAQELLQTQRSDGGWAQLEELESDAYATGSTLVALHEAGGLATTHASYQSGLRFLLSHQQEDGSWQVKSRSKPFQAYFETGYPHGKDQFISSAAGSWATMALTLALPSKPQ